MLGAKSHSDRRENTPFDSNSKHSLSANEYSRGTDESDFLGLRRMRVVTNGGQKDKHGWWWIE